jgi:hypothetical protein
MVSQTLGRDDPCPEMFLQRGSFSSLDRPLPGLFVAQQANQAEKNRPNGKLRQLPAPVGP